MKEEINLKFDGTFGRKVNGVGFNGGKDNYNAKLETLVINEKVTFWAPVFLWKEIFSYSLPFLWALLASQFMREESDLNLTAL